MPRSFKVRYNPQIHLDIQKQVDYYRRKTGDDELGIRFVKTVKAALKELKSSALHYHIGIYHHIPVLGGGHVFIEHDVL
jgi:hypothetical protein